MTEQYLARYECEKCSSNWYHLYNAGDAENQTACPKCEKKKKSNKPFWLGKEFRCESDNKSVRGCGFVFSYDGDVMFHECPNCGKFLAKRIVVTTAVRGERARNTLKAADMAFEEAKKQGFSDMKDSGLRVGEVGAPPINNLITQTMGATGNMGWTGGRPVLPGMAHSDVGGNAALENLQKSIQSGSMPDLVKTAHKIV
jgi:predicted  nucleic acid-binding Zn-ribbon protein